MTEASALSPRKAARAFTPELTDLINTPLYGQVWAGGFPAAVSASVIAHETLDS